jgi:hypothetical protein
LAHCSSDIDGIEVVCAGDIVGWESASSTVSELTLLDIQVILQWTRYSENDDTPLGTMHELCREEGRYANVNIVRPFGLDTIRGEWGSF